MSDKILKLFKTAFEASQDVKGENIIGLDLTQSSSYADYILIVSGTNERQIQAIANRIVEEAFKKCQTHPLGIEGYEGAQWVLVDFGDVVCHIFLDQIRDLYHLEDMWPHVRPLTEDQLEKLFTTKKSTQTTPIKQKKVMIRKSRQ